MAGLKNGSTGKYMFKRVWPKNQGKIQFELIEIKKSDLNKEINFLIFILKIMIFISPGIW